MDNPKTDPKVNPWHPMSDPVDIKHLGKLLEELAEGVNALNEVASAMNKAASAVARCLIQGINEAQSKVAS